MKRLQLKNKTFEHKLLKNSVEYKGHLKVKVAMLNIST